MDDGADRRHRSTHHSRVSLDHGACQHSLCGPTHLRSLARDAHRDLTGGVRGRETEGGCRGAARAPARASVALWGVHHRSAEATTREVLTVAIAEDLAVIHEPDVEDPFNDRAARDRLHPESERWATPKDIFGMWAGASVQIEYFIYGAILMTFGFNFAQALSIIVIGNLSYFLLGLCSPPGARDRHHRLRDQPGLLRPERLAADLVLQLDHPDRLRGRGPHPHRRGRTRAP